ncbi:unnamed protein product [Kuraishia capsulata CBS 1993]|uniref:Uncharacterized protein n=1 Tax=Kuraishia capsulata CBS 1993 TaxID=1382522 RepID=W6MP00_9ASCO|nr:uncharacterized protein KUCA_T00004338001 [Kuraishia capsulata CBS 1993]CDK28356.1 unnamed protein product [Kuraishia capsulata CBS 1993]
MAIKNNLYKQSLVRSANSHLNLLDQQSGERRWTRDWFNPPKPKTNEGGIANGINGIVGSSAPDSQSTTPQPVAIYPFELKTWVLKTDEASEPIVDGDDDDFIDLTKFTTGEPTNTESEASGSRTDSGLSAADIKGAVGGDAIPGFSSSAAQEMKEKELQNQASLDSDKESSQTPVATPSETPAETPASTADSTPEVSEQVGTTEASAEASAQVSAPSGSASVSETPSSLEIVAEPFAAGALAGETGESTGNSESQTDADGDVQMN